MPSVFTHAFAAVSLGKAFADKPAPARFYVLAALCAVLPDADVLSSYFGATRGSLFAHRGFSHSFLFALLVALAVVLLAFRKTRAFSSRWWALLCFFFIVTASHGLLDALTDGGSGVAFFAPFDDARYFFPWRPIEVSPLSLDRFFGPRGAEVIRSEVVWVWLPAAALIILAWLFRRLRGGAK